MCCCRLQDTFFYSLVYDPTQKTLLADKGEIRVGPRFQADVPEMLPEGQSKLHRFLEPLCHGCGCGCDCMCVFLCAYVSGWEGLVLFFSPPLRHFVLLK